MAELEKEDSEEPSEEHSESDEEEEEEEEEAESEVDDEEEDDEELPEELSASCTLGARASGLETPPRMWVPFCLAFCFSSFFSQSLLAWRLVLLLLSMRVASSSRVTLSPVRPKALIAPTSAASYRSSSSNPIVIAWRNVTRL